MSDSAFFPLAPNQDSIRISVSARTDVALFERALRAVFERTEGSNWPGDAPSHVSPGEMIGFRATGATEAILLVQTIAEALGEAESQGVAVVGVDIAGVMAVDEGLRAWGYLLTRPSTESRPEATVVGMPTVDRKDGLRTAEFELRVASPATGKA